MKMPVFYLSHGGGPWPWMEGSTRYDTALLRCLQELPQQLPTTPTAILMVSAHWESENSTFLVQANPNPDMYYDYYNFPEHTYQVRYPAPGNPDLAHHVQKLILDAGGQAQLDTERGFDHGAFVPAFVMYPDATVPMIQLSIDASYDPALHVQLGQALRSLREQGVLILGSGASYHNLRLMGTEGAAPSVAFDNWLEQALVQTPDYADRLHHIEQWSLAPAARIAHAREDHLVPLFVVLGASDEHDAVTRILSSRSPTGIMNASYRFG